jgi:uncharacterized protein (TIGR02145 family)
VPSDSEWTTLIDYLGGKDVAGGKLKEAGTPRWRNPNIGATNTSGFSALPGGCRSSGAFGDVKYGGHWWSSTEGIASNAWSPLLYWNGGYVSLSGNDKELGFSVRCVRDN